MIADGRDFTIMTCICPCGGGFLMVITSFILV